ncbi:MAG: hypothetical protein WCK17_12290 [Verrucomicrobiota bacterium]|jgi:hypothetical protein
MPDITLNDEAQRMLNNALEDEALTPSGHANLVQGANASICIADISNVAA